MNILNLGIFQNRSSKYDFLIIAVWMGIISGIGEGMIFLVAQRFGRLMGISADILWISGLFNLILFGIIAIGSIGFQHLIPRLPIKYPLVFCLLLLTFVDWLGLIFYEKLHRLALIVLAFGLALEFTRRIQGSETKILNFWKRSLPWLATMLLLIIIIFQGGQWGYEQIQTLALPDPEPDAPNVLVILVDTLRADHLSVYGYTRQTSPNIDRIAQQGVLFDNAYATSSWSLPSHVSLLTGLYPHEHGAEWTDPTSLLRYSQFTLAEAMRNLGYRTGAFSANYYWFTREQGFGRGFIHFEDFFTSIEDMVLRTFYGRVFEEFIMRRVGLLDIPARKLAEDINRSLLKWVDQKEDDKFFAFLNLMDTHDPYLPPQPYRNQYSSTPNPGGLLNWRIGQNHPPMTAEQIQSEIDAYDGAISYVDDQIGILFQGLVERGLDQNTLIVITSDHGEAFGEHGVYLHANSLYSEELHIPLIIWQPRLVPSGFRLPTPVSIAALPATIIELAGSDNHSTFEAPSLTSLWKRDDTIQEWTYPLAEIEQQPWKINLAPVHSGSIKSLIDSEWQYIQHEISGVELYNKQVDPGELTNLAEDPKYNHIVELYKAYLAEILKPSKAAGSMQTH